MDLKKSGFSTRAIHAGEDRAENGAIAPPIYQTASFEFESTRHAAEVFSRKRKGYIYTRSGNPTIEALEVKMASLEGGESCLALASGMAAISSAVLTIVKAGDHVIADEVIYGSTYDLFSKHLAKFGIDVDFIDTSDIGNIERKIRKETKLIFYETPANPTMKLIDIGAVSELAGERGIITMVDNTFMTPYFQRPLEHGADIVVYSATKHLNGHGDALGGLVISSGDFISEVRKGMLRDAGAVISPFNAWLIMRGIKTLPVRMDRHEKNAGEIARFLEGHPKVSNVDYPGLENHSQFDLARKQMSGSGGMISFELSDETEVPAFLDRLELCKLAVSLGDTFTLIQHPATMTHAVVPREDRLKYGITDGMVRLSVGLEDAEDIIADLEHGLAEV